MNFKQIACAILLMMAIVGNGATTQAQQFGELLENLNAPWLPRSTSQANAGQADAEDERLETDRDSFTPATTTVKPGRTLVEAAYSYIANRNTANSNSFPEMVTRVGLTKRTELRLGWNFESGGGGSVSNGDAGGDLEQAGSRMESRLLYGLKFSVTEQQDWLPKSALIVQATTPTSGPDGSSDPQVGYVLG